MKNKLLFISLSILTFFPILKVVSAPFPRGSECQIKAEIEEIVERKEPCSPKSWCESWGLPDFSEYIDIKLNIVENSLVEMGDLNINNCNLSDFKEKTFQLLNEKDFKVIKNGYCILAKTQFSGDEFGAGQWLYDIKIINQEECLK